MSALLKQFYGIHEMIFGKLWCDVEYKERYSAVQNRATLWLEMVENILWCFVVETNAV